MRWTEALESFACSIDVYKRQGAYSWWSYRFNARKNNAGWRIDYFLVSDEIAQNVRGAGIRNDIFGSDHCPVTLEIEL